MFSSSDPRDEAFLRFLREAQTVNLGEEFSELDISDKDPLTLSMHRKVLLSLSKRITALNSFFYVEPEALNPLCVKVCACILSQNEHFGDLSTTDILGELRKLRKQRIHALNIANGYVEWVSVQFRKYALTLSQRWWVLSSRLDIVGVEEQKDPFSNKELAALVVVWSYCLIWSNNVRAEKKLAQITHYAS